MNLFIPENPSGMESAEKDFMSHFKNSQQWDGWICYYNLPIKSYEADFVLLSPDGVLYILEVKNYKNISNISVLDYSTILIGKNRKKSPMKQAKDYFYALSDTCIENNINVFIVPLVCYPRISQDEYYSSKLNIVSKEYETLFMEDFESNKIIQKLNSLEHINKYKAISYQKISKTDRLKFRKLFETEHTLQYNMTESIIEEQIEKQPFSHLRVFCEESFDEKTLEETYYLWLKGTKLFLFFYSEQYKEIAFNFYSNKFKSIDSIKNELINYSRKQIFNMEFHILNKNIGGVIIEDDHIDQNDSILNIIKEHSQFNYEQYILIHSQSNHDIIVTAGAGTGKTHSMLGRVAYLVYKEVPDPSKLSHLFEMITFTNEAADNMALRIKKYFMYMYLLTSNYYFYEIAESIYRLRISTIHKYVKEIFEELAPYIGYSSKISVKSLLYYKQRRLDEEIDRANNENREIFSNHKIKSHDLRRICLNIIDQIKQKNIDFINDHINYEIDQLDENKQTIINLILNIALDVETEAVSKALKENSVMLSDIIIELYKRLNDKNCEYLLRNRVKYLFVDEFQDTDDIQIELIVELKKLMGFKLFIVGDVKQCIYRFRGADDDAFEKIARFLPETQTSKHTLKLNYRTQAGLIKEINKICYGFNNYIIMDQMNLMNFTSNDSLRAINDDFEVSIDLVESNEITLIEEVVSKVKDVLKNSDKTHQVAILVRENWQISSIRTALMENDIPVKTKVDYHFFNKPAVIDFYKLVKALIYYKEPVTLYQLSLTPYACRSNISNLQNKNVVKFFNDGAVIPKWKTFVSNVKYEPALKVLKDLIYYIKPWEAAPKMRATNIESMTDYKEHLEMLFELITSDLNSDYMTLNQIEEILRIRILTKNQEVREVSKDSNEGYVNIMTVHGSKGLEFDTVIIPFLNHPIKPHSYMRQVETIISKEEGLINVGLKVKLNDHLSIRTGIFNRNIKQDECYSFREEARVLYVAITRAKERLVLFDNQKCTKELTWNKMLSRRLE